VGTLLLPSDYEYIRKTMAGYVGLQGSSARMINGRLINIYAKPMYHDLQISGVIVALFNSDFFDHLNFPETFEQGSCSYIADKTGTIIYHPGHCSNQIQFDSINKEISRDWDLKGKAGIELKEKINGNLSGTIQYINGKQDLYISFVPINFHGWYLISIVDADAAEAQSKSIYDDVISVFLYILIITVAVAAYLIYIRTQHFKRLERRMQIDSIKDESYRMIMEQTNDIIFEFDIKDKKYIHTSNFKKNFGYEPTNKGFLGSLETDYIHPDDVVHYVGMLERMRKDGKLTEGEVRIINSDGEYLWSRIFILGVFDQDKKLAKVIGKIVNIHEKKKELQVLKEKAIKDSATGVYNKKTTEDMIKAFLSSDGKTGRHAMLIIDIDDFKGVNDEYGHRLGDTVISELGLELHQIFRTSDIKGRIGGDEFMILMKDTEDVELISDKARKICGMFREWDAADNNRINITFSIGIAIYDKDGKTYDDLYEAADKALYLCKSRQKGTFAFYERAQEED